MKFPFLNHMNINAEKLTDEILRVETNSNRSDHLAVIICSYFENHPDNPHDGEMDEYETWEQWVIDRYDEIKQEIQLTIKHSFLENTT